MVQHVLHTAVLIRVKNYEHHLDKGGIHNFKLPSRSLTLKSNFKYIILKILVLGKFSTPFEIQKLNGHQLGYMDGWQDLAYSDTLDIKIHFSANLLTDYYNQIFHGTLMSSVII